MPESEKFTPNMEVASAPGVSEPAEEAQLDKKEPVKQEPVKPKAPALSLSKPVLVSFARWFAARGKERGWKPHWQAGMRAYANTAGRLSMEGWDEVFKEY